jgi:hypothetical protein
LKRSDSAIDTGKLLRLVVYALLSGGCAGALAQDAAPPAPPPEPAPAEAAPASPPAPAEKPAEDGSKASITLPGVQVGGKHDALSESDKRLKALQDSLPCTGCDATPHTHKKLVKRVVDAVGERVTPTDAPDHSTREANDKAEDMSKEGVCGAGNMAACAPANAQP